MSKTDKKVVFITAGSMAEAEKIAKSLVEENLAVCVNIIPSIRSVYRWEGKVCDDNETLLIAKTNDKNLESLTARVEKLHSYSTPEVISISIDGGSEKYLAWMDRCLCKTM
ncbi:Periplasmic divalent cation tolerance protein CutA [hydrothermal vent metagenome]|uniref:Periplasmic divalent cation tolerance protein CutA n=1 Tax=hydrothermal vent metagenome TaxID=652676 RepID=A0A3B1B9Y4_9ZZZZ